MADAEPDISVVVPIYNAEPYLRECVDSILNQTHENIEVILVNDGSLDSSLAIMRDYEAADSRVCIIDKANAGYGHSVNRGIEVATGKWLSIVEPDDIIDLRMYADLLANATIANGTPPDVVKSSYWLYYDHEDDTQPYVEKPNLMKYMPDVRMEVTSYPRAFRELLFHHPSIWSAIYRRDFIEQHSIRMVEPKGAGWADNPWFFDTMLRAKSIVWFPRAYYYYRQTNSGASSKLPYVDVPFDRLYDMRQIVASLGFERDENVLIPLYNRSFCYILESVLDEYGYPENDPHIRKRIREVLEAMNEKTVLEARTGVPLAHKSYYKDVMGLHLTELSPTPKPTQPFLSIILAMNNDAQLLWPTVLSLTKQSFHNFEVVCVDTGSHNRFAEIVEDISAVDKRFSVIQLGESASVAEAFNTGLKTARGEYVQLWRPGVTYQKGDDLERIISQFSKAPHSPDVVVTRSAPTAVLLSNSPVSAEVTTASVPAEATDERATLAGVGICGMLFARSLLREHGLSFSEGDNDGRVFACTSLDAADSVTVISGLSPNSEAADTQAVAWLEWADAPSELVPFISERISAVATHISELSNSALGYATLIVEYEKARDLLLATGAGAEAFEAVATIFREHFATVDVSAVPAALSGRYADISCFFLGNYTDALEYEMTRLHSDMSVAKGRVKELISAKRKIKAMRESTSFRIGNALVNTANKAVPHRALQSLKSRFR